MHNPKPPPVTLRPPPPMPPVPPPRPEAPKIQKQLDGLYRRLWQSEQRIEQLERSHRFMADLIAASATLAIVATVSLFGVLGTLYLFGEM